MNLKRQIREARRRNRRHGREAWRRGNRDARLVLGLAALFGCLFFFCTGCASDYREAARPAPSSSMTMGDARAFAEKWSSSRPGRAYFAITPTGSMAPLLDSRSLVLVEKFAGKLPNRNDICIYDFSRSAASVCHWALEVDPRRRAVIFGGGNNFAPDEYLAGVPAWISTSRINWRVAGILYTQR